MPHTQRKILRNSLVLLVKKKFNTVQLMDSNTQACLERPVHLKNIIKFNTTMV
ncbi:hypothetical protein H8356DRAFT_1343733 [Neocallimastix lanati (nom. inval.)]|nr:hypothetical protein H8356DRAFT_1343733 [Neocallimastix sp. JGI-2020a]